MRAAPALLILMCAQSLFVAAIDDGGELSSGVGAQEGQARAAACRRLPPPPP